MAGLRILVVDDEPLARRALARLAARPGDTVVEASSAAEAIRLLRGPERFDLVLTDLVMPPGDNGFKVIEAARSADPPVRSALVSAYVDADTTDLALDMGAEAVFEKPIDVAKIRAFVAAADPVVGNGSGGPAAAR